MPTTALHRSASSAGKHNSFCSRTREETPWPENTIKRGNIHLFALIFLLQNGTLAFQLSTLNEFIWHLHFNVHSPIRRLLHSFHKSYATELRMSYTHKHTQGYIHIDTHTYGCVMTTLTSQAFALLQSHTDFENSFLKGLWHVLLHGWMRSGSWGFVFEKLILLGTINKHRDLVTSDGYTLLPIIIAFSRHLNAGVYRKQRYSKHLELFH